MGGRREEEEVWLDRQAQETHPQVKSDRRKRIRLRVGHKFSFGGLQCSVSIPASSAETSRKPGPVEGLGGGGGARARARARKAKARDCTQRPVREVLCKVRSGLVVSADAVRALRSI